MHINVLKPEEIDYFSYLAEWKVNQSQSSWWKSESEKWKKVKMKSLGSCPTLCDHMDCSLPGSSIHSIFQARVLEWIAISFSRGSSQPRYQSQVSRIAGGCFTVWATDLKCSEHTSKKWFQAPKGWGKKQPFCRFNWMIEVLNDLGAQWGLSDLVGTSKTPSIMQIVIQLLSLQEEISPQPSVRSI